MEQSIDKTPEFPVGLSVPTIHKSTHHRAWSSSWSRSFHLFIYGSLHLSNSLTVYSGKDVKFPFLFIIFQCLISVSTSYRFGVVTFGSTVQHIALFSIFLLLFGSLLSNFLKYSLSSLTVCSAEDIRFPFLFSINCVFATFPILTVLQCLQNFLGFPLEFSSFLSTYFLLLYSHLYI